MDDSRTSLHTIIKPNFLDKVTYFQYTINFHEAWKIPELLYIVIKANFLDNKVKLINFNEAWKIPEISTH